MLELEELVIATKNQGKLKEFQSMLLGVAKVIRSVPEDFVMPEETGSTFQENSLIKADAVSRALQLPVLADDSGLMVDALGGDPGVYSARFGGEGLDDTGRNQLLLRQLQTVPWEKRTAKFVAALTLVWPDGRKIEALGECPGMILFDQKGEKGFGYDPVFYYPPLDRSFSEITMTEKNEISHRTLALRNLLQKLK